MLLLIALTGALAVSLVTVAPVVTPSATTDSSLAPDTTPHRASDPLAKALPATGDGTQFAPLVESRPWRTIVLHHSATSGGSVASIDDAHRRQKDPAGKPWLGIGYHFVVGNGRPMADGEIQPTFRWLKQLPGAHAGKRQYNDDGIGICLIGNFDETRPTDRQMAAIGSLLTTLARRYSIPRERIVRHQDVHATLCPGRLFPMDELLAVVSAAKRL